MKMLNLLFLSSTRSFYKEPQKEKGCYLSAETGTTIFGQSIPKGTYRLDNPLNPEDPGWFERLMSCKV